MERETLKAAVREYYARRVRGSGCCGAAECGPPATGAPTTAGAGRDACGTAPESGTVDAVIAGIPSYGCGTPFARTLFDPGDVVVDLGSGHGRDALVIAGAVGAAGRVIGVDMTPEMIGRARAAAERAGAANVEFRLGDIEALPVADGTADVVISNCVLTLVPDKGRAFAEAFRILRPGGRFIVNDIVATAPIPEAVRDDPEQWSACVSGAVAADQYGRLLAGAGFADISITPNGAGAGAYATYSARVTARRPRR